jgi:N-acetylneuraminic acid mutarotase
MTPRSKQLVVAIGLGVLLLAVFGFSFRSSPWEEVAPLPNPRLLHGAAVGWDGKIYVLGGFTIVKQGDHNEKREGDGTNAMVVYDPKTNRWEKHTLMPINRSYWHEVRRGRLHSYGEDIPGVSETYLLDDQGVEKLRRYGADLKNSPIRQNDLEFKPFAIFHPVRGVIRFSQGKLFGEALAVASDHQGKLYWIGGEELGGMVKWVYVIDTKSHRAPEDILGPPPMHHARANHTATTGPDGKIYVVGGESTRDVPDKNQSWRPRGVVLDSLEVFDPETNTWTEKAPMHYARQMHAAAFAPNGKLYVFGGYADTEVLEGHAGDPDYNKQREAEWDYHGRHPLSSVEAYDPKTDAWQEVAPMPLPRQNMGAALGSDGRIYVIGGFESYVGSTPPQKDVQIYDPRADRWAEGPPLNTGRGGHTAVATPDGKIYVIGGTNGFVIPSISSMLFGGEPNSKGGPLDNVEVLDTRRLANEHD